ncbi:uncharacterized protein LOC129895290 isoform X2 [Solanum dulcamara]|uniref:uncharacterized protein LOC129895290 isoform X2 n=1 Tax=Solanum dulcamara TaxID=45834 RepID=UPI002486A398|nr:uncharacterized protein LOC129895290 isoform X2 [Solanum dulcamara]
MENSELPLLWKNPRSAVSFNLKQPIEAAQTRQSQAKQQGFYGETPSSNHEITPSISLQLCLATLLENTIQVLTMIDSIFSIEGGTDARFADPFA